MNWIYEDIGLDSKEIQGSLLDAEITFDNFIEIWEKFFKEVFVENEEKENDTIRCEIWGTNWNIVIYPYSSIEHIGDETQRLWVNLPEHYESVNPLVMDSEVMGIHEERIEKIQESLMRYIIGMLKEAFSVYHRKIETLPNQLKDIERIEFYTFDDELVSEIVL